MKLFYSCLLVLFSLALISTEAAQHHFSRTTAAYCATASLYGFTAASFLATAYCAVSSSRLRYGPIGAKTSEHQLLYDVWTLAFLLLGIAGLGNVYCQYTKPHANKQD